MKRRNFLKKIIGVGGLLSFSGVVYGYHSNKIRISREKIIVSDFPEKLRIVAVSDLHLPSYWIDPEYFIQLVNSENPDIFVLAGDTIDQRGNEHYAKIFKDIQVNFEKIAILGNWEYQGLVNAVVFKKILKEAGVQFLVNEYVEVAGLNIIGLDDFTQGAPDFPMIKELLKTGKPLVVLSHCPQSFDFMPLQPENPFFVISGHTHGGQIAPFGLILHTPIGSGEYVKGWYHHQHNSMYVMRGVGTTGIPLRIGANPEILVLDIN
jgi:predicted MPP superfamily phosphohydrolase